MVLLGCAKCESVLVEPDKHHLFLCISCGMNFSKEEGMLVEVSMSKIFKVSNEDEKCDFEKASQREYNKKY